MLLQYSCCSGNPNQVCSYSSAFCCLSTSPCPWQLTVPLLVAFLCKGLSDRHLEASLVETKQRGYATNDAHFDSNEASSKSQHNRPLLKQQAQVQTAASCHKEQTQQNAPEGPDISLNLHHPTHMSQNSVKKCATKYIGYKKLEAHTCV